VPGNGLIDYSHLLPIGRVAIVDGAPGNDLDSRSLKVLAGDAVELRVHIFFGRWSVARNRDVRGPVASADGRSGRQSDGFDSRKGGKTFKQLLVQTGRLAGLVSGKAGVEFSEKQMRALEAVILSSRDCAGCGERALPQPATAARA
jgi:hypothetical protein